MKREEFWSRVTKSEGCWTWNGAKQKFGYGWVWIDGEGSKNTHRVAYEIGVGPIPAGQCVLHRCDNPPCVNPAHLFLGTKGDNTRDMVSKNRHVLPPKKPSQPPKPKSGRKATGRPFVKGDPRINPGGRPRKPVAAP